MVATCSNCTFLQILEHCVTRILLWSVQIPKTQSLYFRLAVVVHCALCKFRFWFAWSSSCQEVKRFESSCMFLIQVFKKISPWALKTCHHRVTQSRNTSNRKPLFRNERFMLDEMTWQNTSKFVIFYIYENPKLLFPFFISLYFIFSPNECRST